MENKNIQVYDDKITITLNENQRVSINLDEKTQQIETIYFSNNNYEAHNEHGPAHIDYRNGKVCAEEWLTDGLPYERETGEPNLITYYKNGKVETEKWIRREPVWSDILEEYIDEQTYQIRENGKPNEIYYYENGNKETEHWNYNGGYRIVYYNEDGTFKREETIKADEIDLENLPDRPF